MQITRPVEDNVLTECIDKNFITLRLANAKISEVERISYIAIVEKVVRPVVLVLSSHAYKHALERQREDEAIDELNRLKFDLQKNKILPDYEPVVSGVTEALGRWADAYDRRRRAAGAVSDILSSIEGRLEKTVEEAIILDAELG